MKYVADSDTSYEAAVAIEESAATLRGQLYRLLARSNGLTDEEMQIQTQMLGSTQRPRRVELVESGLIEDSGLTRETRSGRKAVVWRAKPTQAQRSLWSKQ